MTLISLENKTPIQMLKHWVETKPQAPYIRYKTTSGIWSHMTWGDFYSQVKKLTQWINDKKLPAKSHIAILSKNSPEWLITDFAIWASGHISIPIYPNLIQERVREILDHSDTKAIFIGKVDEKIERGLVNHLSFSVNIDQTQNYFPMSQLTAILETTEESNDIQNRELDELATIVYTSGSTGQPKGVMHPFRSFYQVSYGFINEIGLSEKEHRFFSYLTFAHVVERALIQSVPLYLGSEIAFASSIQNFIKDISHIKPTVFFSVPRLWTKMKLNIENKIGTKTLNLLLSLPLLNQWISQRIKANLGLSEAQYVLSGAAPLSNLLFNWFSRLGIKIQNTYGMSEDFAYSYHSRVDRLIPGSVGHPLPGVQGRIDESGEILLKSPCQFTGYYKEPHLKKTTDDGYFHTGDVGNLSEDHCLTITGRLKEKFKTTKGKYVSPALIESKFTGASYIEQICVIGSNLPQPMALVCLDTGEKVKRDEVAQLLSVFLENINKGLDRHERLSHLVVMETAWTIENEYLTPTLKPKRNKIESNYRDLALVISQKEKAKVVYLDEFLSKSKDEIKSTLKAI